MYGGATLFLQLSCPRYSLGWKVRNPRGSLHLLVASLAPKTTELKSSNVTLSYSLASDSNDFLLLYISFAEHRKVYALWIKIIELFALQSLSYLLFNILRRLLYPSHLLKCSKPVTCQLETYNYCRCCSFVEMQTINKW